MATPRPPPTVLIRAKKRVAIPFFGASALETRREDKLVSGCQAADAAAERARERVREVEQAGPLADAQEALLRHLSSLRAAVAEGIEQAPDLNALRNVLGAPFERVDLRRWDWPVRADMPI